jgi:hypothetical protein
MACPSARHGNHCCINSKKGDIHTIVAQPAETNSRSRSDLPLIYLPLHNLFLQVEPPPPATCSLLVPSDSSPAGFPYKYHCSRTSNHTHTSAFEDGSDRGFRNVGIYIYQTPGNYPKENLLYSEHGESLKSGMNNHVGEMIAL